MPPTPQMIQNAIKKLNSLTLQSFTATPQTIRPYKGGSKLAWQVDLPGPQLGAAVLYFINNLEVQGNTLTISPVVTTVYTLRAVSSTASKNLNKSRKVIR